MNDRRILRPGLLPARDVEVGDVIRKGKYFATVLGSTQIGEMENTYFRFDTTEGPSRLYRRNELVEVWTP